MKNKTFEVNAGTGMVIGIFIGVAVAFVVQLITGDSDIWSWAIPVGLATGLAIGSGRSNNAAKKES
ncbi:MAG: hypothetical protein DHS20C20_06040 [Ardenticatenaceae bacterium]|nr:MAG: hypothetical protein DHS20C20_06040 [Ardenticatenaceae bacterium]